MSGRVILDASRFMCQRLAKEARIMKLARTRSLLSIQSEGGA